MYRQDIYENIKTRCEELKKQQSEKKAAGGRVSLFRAITFIAGFCLIAAGIFDDFMLGYILGAAFFIAFIFLIRYHSKLDRQLKVIDSLWDSANKFCMRFEDKWNQFCDTGEEFIKEGDYFSTDVDMLGKNSLYQKINLGHTLYGRRKLAASLSQPDFTRDEIQKRKEAILELTQDVDFAVSLTSATARVSGDGKKEKKVAEFAEYCVDESTGVLPGWADFVRIALPVIEIILIALWAIGFTHYGFALVGFLVLLSFSILTKAITDSVIAPLYIMSVKLDDYREIMEIIKNKTFNSKKLTELQLILCDSQGALSAFNQLRGISQAYNISFNPVVHQLLCGILLWDYQLAVKVCKWKKQYGKNVGSCFEIIGEFEELISLAGIGMLHQCTEAVIDYNNDKVDFKAENIYHPLINQSNVVANSATIKNGITIITGSNMSGKTTFLRTMAINLGLAYIGAPVCAKCLSAGYMKIFTSMRVTDDVAHGISTFYAEILRIKTMAEYKKTGKPMLCLIDEIFKGTNSADRIVGAKEVITSLSGDNSMVVVSTHDFELCNLTSKDGSTVINYHFEEYYDNDELKFDYTIKDGKCTTTNAKAILKMAGFQV